MQLELAVGRGDSAAGRSWPPAWKAPQDPRLTGPLRACLAEQALNAGDLAAAAGEVLDGLAALEGADLAEEEIRLLAAGARAAADLQALPEAARPRDIAELWEPTAATFAAPGPGHRRRRRRTVACGWPRSGRWPPPSRPAGTAPMDRATWRGVAEAWQAASQPYREAYARLREAEAAVRAGRREQAERALAACARPWPASCRPLRCSAWPVSWPGGRG